MASHRWQAQVGSVYISDEKGQAPGRTPGRMFGEEYLESCRDFPIIIYHTVDGSEIRLTS